MRPLRLELRGFTVFREPAVLDFEGRRLFAITGPTGSGKSSLLDAMTWALYGEVPRVGRATRQLVTHGARSMAAQLDFSVRGQRYRVSRQAPGAIGTRLERAAPGGSWEPLADRAREVTARVTSLLGLDFQTFTKTVLLPQGAFDTFLRGDEPQRREILSRLLGLDLYAEVGRVARSRAGGAESAAGALRTQLERLDAATPEAIAAFEAQQAALAARAAELERRSADLEALAVRAQGLREAQAAAAAAAQAEAAAARVAAASELAQGEALAVLEPAAASRDGLEAELAALGYDPEAHRRLEREAALLEQRAAAGAAVERAQAEHTAAEAGVAEQGRAASALAGTAGEARSAATAAAQEAVAAAASLAVALGPAAQAATALRAAAEEATHERAQAERSAAMHEERRRHLEALGEQLGAALAGLERAGAAKQDAARCRDEAATASQEAAAALHDRDRTAAAALAALEVAQLEAAAANLQRSLAPGDPCPVCGEPVGELVPHAAPDLDAARAAVEPARGAVERARAAHQLAAAELAAAGERSEQARTALAAAEARLGELDGALAEVGAGHDELADALSAAATAVQAAIGGAASATRRAEHALEHAHELDVAIAAVPPGLPPSLPALPDEAPPQKPGEALDVLRTRMAEHGRARARADAAETAARRTEEQAREAAAAAEHAAERLAHVVAALDRAEQQLDALGPAPGDAAAVEAAVRAATEQAARHAALLEAAQAAAQQQAAAVSRLEARGEEHARAAVEAAARHEERERTEREATARRAEFAAAWAALPGVLPDPAAPDPDVTAPPALLAAHQGERSRCAAELGVAGERLEAARLAARTASQMRADAAGYDGAARLAAALEQELHRNRFIAYVQREAMQLLAQDAAERLLELSSGRYRLAAEGDEFSVVDRLNGDERRSVKTLSGGETFLASLALALALSERLPEIAGRGGAMSLESLFLDEGFGALDQESLDVAIDGLEALSGGSRVIGVISHVPEVAERLADRIEVVKSGATSHLRDPRIAAEVAAESDAGEVLVGAAPA